MADGFWFFASIIQNDAQEILSLLGLLLPLIFFGVVWKHRRGMGATALVLYAAAYMAFSFSGSYVCANHGGAHWRVEWCPSHLVEEYTAFSGRTRTRFTSLGAIFWPCIWIDRTMWHPDKSVK